MKKGKISNNFQLLEEQNKEASVKPYRGISNAFRRYQKQIDSCAISSNISLESDWSSVANQVVGNEIAY